MNRYLVELRTLCDWQSRLGDPVLHWKRGASAMELAIQWTMASVRPGSGLEAGTTMGPLARGGRGTAISELVDDARALGARVALGGERLGDVGHFFAPTVLCDVPPAARLLHTEPFGPVAAMMPFNTLEDAIAEANRLPYGLAAYAFTRSLKTATAVSSELESGMVSINHIGLALPELPFGGIKDSGYGSEGGAEAIESYLNTKMVSQIGI